MSRSYKKTPGFTDNNHSHESKKRASRRFRRTEKTWDYASGKSYRRHTNPWDICDWKCLDYSMIELKSRLALDYDENKASKSRWWGVRGNESKSHYVARKISKYRMK